MTTGTDRTPYDWATDDGAEDRGGDFSLDIPESRRHLAKASARSLGSIVVGKLRALRAR